MSQHNFRQRCTKVTNCQCPKHCLCAECLFYRKSRDLYDGLASRLKEKKWKSGPKAGTVRREKQELSFTIEQFRSWLIVVLEDEPFCEYCDVRIDIMTISPDHAQPVSRGGSQELANLRGACSGCNRAKGSLMPGEFKALLTGLATFTEAGRNDVMKRLRGGILHFGSKKKELKVTNVLALPAAKEF